MNQMSIILLLSLFQLVFLLDTSHLSKSRIEKDNAMNKSSEVVELFEAFIQHAQSQRSYPTYEEVVQYICQGHVPTTTISPTSSPTASPTSSPTASPTPSTGTKGNYIYLNAASASADGNDVSEWADESGTGKNFKVLSDCGTPKLAQSSWDSSISVIRFGLGGQSCLQSVAAYPVPDSITFVAVISWRGGGGTWEPIASAANVLYSKYWNVRIYSNWEAINIDILNWVEPGVPIAFNTPYIVVGRFDDSTKKCSMWLWDIVNNRWKGKKSHDNVAGMPPNGNEVISIGRDAVQSAAWMDAELASIAMWDRFLLDEEVNILVEEYKTTYGQ